MKNNKNNILKQFLLIGVVLLICLPVFASPIEELNLTDQQVASIKIIIRQANEKVMQEGSELQSARPRQIRGIMDEIQTIRNKALSEIRGQLDPNQQAVFDQWSAQRQSENERKKEMLKSLDLTRQQKIQIAKISESSEEAAWRIVGDNSITKSELRQQLTQLRANTMRTIRQQLTPEQQVNFDTWQQQAK
ncbi:Hypothetical protein LUCI_3798 [Lucifera butyrica]|uniref:Uncharacterized protein n=2 Tax=Lucifera butyrica TaxID=1351585 RepID=A0A498RC56_9FIRM|nr:Hypothetical protein LUCI_3798 [Lucifera butyrica]